MALPNRDERTAAAAQNPSPSLAKPVDERTVEKDRPTATQVRGGVVQETVPVNFDEDFVESTQHRTPRSEAADRVSTDSPPPDETQGPAGEPGPSPTAPQTVRVKFRGAEREIPIETAVTLAQQAMAMSDNGPVVELAEQIRQKTGITDPRQIAQIIQDALTKAGGQAPQPGQPAVDPRKVAQAQAGAAQPKLNLPPPKSDEEVDQAISEMETANGITLTPAVRSSFANMVRYGDSIGQITQTYAGLYAAAQQSNRDLHERSTKMLASAIDMAAGKAAKELDIDTPEEFQAFQQWVGETNKVYPGFVQRIKTSPEAMERAVRDFHEISTGRKAIAERKRTHEKVNNDLVRAGGDLVTPRPGSGQPGGEPPDDGPIPALKGHDPNFNKNMMERM